MNLVLSKLSEFDFCGNSDVQEIISLIGILFRLFKLIIPLIIIAYGIFDLYKSVSNPDENKTTAKLFIKRIISGLLIFFLPELIIFIFNHINTNMNLDSECLDAFLNPKKISNNNSSGNNSGISNYESIDTEEECNNLERPYIWKNGQCVIDVSKEKID